MQNKKMSRHKTIALRNLLLIGVGAALALTLAGCSRKQTNQVQTSDELTIWSPLDAEETFLPLIRKYQLENPGQQINYVFRDFQDYEIDSLDALASLEGPDIWLIRNDWIDKHRNKLVAMPREFLVTDRKSTLTLTQAFSDTFWPAQSSDLIIQSKVWGVPLYMDQLSLFINDDVVQQGRDEIQAANPDVSVAHLDEPPRTWEQFIRYAKDLTARDSNGKITRAGAALGSAQIPNASDILAMIMIQNGTSMMSADRTRPEFHLPQRKANGQSFNPGANAITFYTDFARAGSDKQVWSDSLGDAAQAFIEGKAAAILHYRWFAKAIEQKNPALNYSIEPIPQIGGSTDEAGMAQYWVFTVTKNAESQNTAWGFLAWFVDNALGDYRNITDRMNPFKPEKIDKGDRTDIEYQASIARSWPKPNANEADAILRSAIDSVLRGGVNPQTALEAAASAVSKLVVEPTPAPTLAPSTQKK